MAIDESRRHFLTALLLPSLGVISGCGAPDLSGRTEEEPPHSSTEVQVAGPHAGSQLISGWYNVERNSWRWTAGKFAVLLRPPIGSPAKGAILTFTLYPAGSCDLLLHSAPLSASIQGTKLAPETYQKAGRALYTRDVARKPALRHHRAEVDFPEL